MSVFGDSLLISEDVIFEASTFCSSFILSIIDTIHIHLYHLQQHRYYWFELQCVHNYKIYNYIDTLSLNYNGTNDYMFYTLVIYFVPFNFSYHSTIFRLKARSIRLSFIMIIN